MCFLSSALTTEAADSSERSVQVYRATRHVMPKGGSLHNHDREGPHSLRWLVAVAPPLKASEKSGTEKYFSPSSSLLAC
jgi:hypothetical protein